MKQIITIAFVWLLLSACKKKTIVTIDKVEKKINRITQNGISLNYYYDDIGRLVSRTAPEGTGTYSYAPLKVTEKLLNTSGIQTDELVYELNAEGLAVKTYKADSAWLFTTYEYNAGKQVIREVFSGDNNGSIETLYFYAADGDLDSALVKQTGMILKKRIFQFDDNQENVMPASIFGINFFGKEPPHLIIRQAETDYITGHVHVDVYTYERDSRGRITKITRSVPGTTLSEAVTYNYD